MAKKLRKGTAKYLLQNSIESVLTAVEIYNKPKTQFKLQSFITLMIIGWSKALHSYFYKDGIKYYYKKNALEQKKSQKRQLSKELVDIKHYIEKFKTSYHHTQLAKYYQIKPNKGEDPFNTKTEYCLL